MTGKNVLTPAIHFDILHAAGETEADFAGEQLTRDNGSGCDGHPSGESETGSHPSLGLRWKQAALDVGIG